MKVIQELEKWGNSQGVRIPKKVVRAARLTPNQPLAVSLKGRTILLTPTDSDHALRAMLEGVTRRDIAGEWDWGEDIGAERYE